MYDSLKEWMTCPFQIKRFRGYTASADKNFSQPEDALGYFVGNVETITDSSGDDVVSSSQLYINPETTTIEPLDVIIVDGQEKDIIQITNYMDGNTGTSSIKVVYL
jgi:hypothetical protein